MIVFNFTMNCNIIIFIILMSLTKNVEKNKGLMLFQAFNKNINNRSFDKKKRNQN
jgi:hypothetical protein